MNKENKKKAMEQRAQERRKQQKKSQAYRVLANWGPVVIIAVAVIALMILIIFPKGRDEGAGDDTEFGFDLVDENGNSLDVTDWTELEEKELDTAAGAVVSDGDMVNIDYEGRHNGELFDGGTSSDEDVEIGVGAYVEGFEEGLVGHAVGETFEMPVTFPDGYGGDLGGEEVVFTVTINGIYR